MEFLMASMIPDFLSDAQIHNVSDPPAQQVQGHDISGHTTHYILSPPHTSTSRDPFNEAATAHIMEGLPRR